MNITPKNNTSSKNSGGNKKWDKTSLISAVISGSMTIGAANLLLAKDDPEASPIEEEDILIPLEEPSSDPLTPIDSSHSTSSTPVEASHSSSTVGGSHSETPVETPTSHSDTDTDEHGNPLLEVEPTQTPTVEHAPTTDSGMNANDVPVIEEIEVTPIDFVLYGEDYIIGEIETLEDGTHVAHLTSEDGSHEILMVDNEGDGCFSSLQSLDGRPLSFEINDISIGNLHDLPEEYSIIDPEPIECVYGPPEDFLYPDADMYGPLYPDDWVDPNNNGGELIAPLIDEDEILIEDEEIDEIIEVEDSSEESLIEIEPEEDNAIVEEDGLDNSIDDYTENDSTDDSLPDTDFDGDLDIIP